MTQVRSPIISFVVPTRNRVALLERALNSVLRQNASRVEVVVIDDDSSDGTQAMLTSQKCTLVQAHRNEAQRGVATSRNVGASMAIGSWLWFLDDDDELRDGSIRRIEPLLEDQHNVVMFLLETLAIDGHREVPRQQCVPDRLDRSELLTLKWRPISGSQLVVKRDYFYVVGGFDETLNSSEDVDFWMTLITHKAMKLKVLHEVLGTKHEHSETQLSRDLPVAFAGHQRLLKKWTPVMKDRLASADYQAWYTKRLLVLFYYHCRLTHAPTAPLGRRDSFTYAMQWFSLIFTKDRKSRRLAAEKTILALLRACFGAEFYSKIALSKKTH